MMRATYGDDEGYGSAYLPESSSWGGTRFGVPPRLIAGGRWGAGYVTE